MKTLALAILIAICWPPPEVQANDMKQVMQKASELNIRRLKYFEGGVYGKLGESVFYITTIDKAPDLDRLYHLMMKMLSKTYGCFMTRRIKENGLYHFFCKDSRKVTMKPVFGKKLVLFQSIQKDRYGRTIIKGQHYSH